MKQNTWKLLNNAVLETLESREMMSTTPLATATLRSGILSINGNPTQGTRIQLDNLANGSQIGVEFGGKHAAFPADQINQINITTGSGADYIYINPAIDIPADIHSGDGNDIVRSGGGNDTIIAGNGNDLIHGKGGNNFMQAGDGNDSLYGEGGNDTFIVGNGNDSLVGGGGTDIMTAGNGNDTFSAGTGHDTITAGTGQDVMIGGLGNTYLYGKTETSAAASTNPTTTPTTIVSATPTLGSGSTTGTTAGTTTNKTTTGTTTTVSSGSTSTTSGSSTSTGASSSTGTTTTVSGTQTNSTAPVVTNPTGAIKPTAVINLLAGPRSSGLSVNVDALKSTVGEGSVITSNYEWDFGDPNTPYNQLSGFNAAHVYDTPGTYTIKLTVTNDSGLVSTTSQTVTIAPSVRTQIFVDDSSGSDTNAGTSDAPLRSLAAAFKKVGDNTEILLKAGESFNTNIALSVNNSNVLIGRYGDGANPTIIRLVGNGLPTITSGGNTNGLTIQDITFNSIYGVNANQQAPKNSVGGIFVGGENVAIRDCTFLNVDDAINENQIPTGVLVQDNTAPLTTGVRGYFTWVQGNQTTIVGNFAANSTREHIVRAVDFNEINVQDNNFTNLNRQSVDPYDFSKGCVELHRGQYGWVVGNTITDGDIRIGPLGLFGEAASSATNWTVIEDNQLTDTFIYVQAGAHDSMIANNVITNEGADGSYDIVMNGTDSQGRTSSDINLVNNTGVDTGQSGNFLRIYGWVNGITMVNNLWVAPDLSIGEHSAAPVFTSTSDLSCFTRISGNVWPDPINIPGFAQGGINYVSSSSGNNFLTPTAWNSMSEVGTDMFVNTKLVDSYQISVDSVIAGADIKIAA